MARWEDGGVQDKEMDWYKLGRRRGTKGGNGVVHDGKIEWVAEDGEIEWYKMGRLSGTRWEVVCTRFFKQYFGIAYSVSVLQDGLHLTLTKTNNFRSWDFLRLCACVWRLYYLVDMAMFGCAYDDFIKQRNFWYVTVYNMLNSPIRDVRTKVWFLFVS